MDRGTVSDVLVLWITVNNKLIVYDSYDVRQFLWSKMPSDSGSAWSPPASNSERRLSNSSDGSAGSGYSKAVSSSVLFIT